MEEIKVTNSATVDTTEVENQIKDLLIGQSLNNALHILKAVKESLALLCQVGQRT